MAHARATKRKTANPRSVADQTPDDLKEVYEEKYKFYKETLRIPEKKARKWAQEFVELARAVA